MPRAISGSPQDLKLLKAGLCPDCGAAVTAGMVACGVCKVTFGVHASVLQAPAAPAAPPRAAAPAMARAPSTSRGLTAEQIDELERGLHARSLFPHSFAEGPDNGGALGLGSALARAAQLVMADAALVDDPLVLAGAKATPAAIPRAMHNAASSSAAMVDDAPPVTSSPKPPPRPPAPPAARAPAPPARAFAAPPPTAPDTAPHVATTAPVATAVPLSEEPETMPEQPAFDPDATLKHDADEMARTIKAAQELIAARGGAQRLE